MEKLLRDRDIKADLGGISNTTMWRYRRDGLLPKPRKIAGQNVTPLGVYLDARERLLEGGDA